jgi:SAM-dependent methyltransferase
VSEYSSELIAHFSGLLIQEGGYTKADFAAGYERYRPAPPDALLDVLCLEAQVSRPKLVVDLGSGTGLSTRAWAERADEVVGVEASAEMCARADDETAASNVRYVHAFAQETGLPDGAADIVTCSQSLHWMEPEPTFAEVARILRPGGVFAAYDYDWPPLCHWEVELAFTELVRRVGEARKGTGRPPWSGRPRYDKPEHLERIRASGQFRFAREIGLHSRIRGDADRIVGMALSLGPLVVLLEHGLSEEDLGLAQLRETAARTLGDRESDWFMSYRVRLAVK